MDKEWLDVVRFTEFSNEQFDGNYIIFLYAIKSAFLIIEAVFLVHEITAVSRGIK